MKLIFIKNYFISQRDYLLKFFANYKNNLRVYMLKNLFNF
jgi:hypothetical protein